MTNNSMTITGDPRQVHLLPCPFCGRDLTRGSRRINPNARCTTENCFGAKMPVVNLDLPASVEAWNTRTQVTLRRDCERATVTHQSREGEL